MSRYQAEIMKEGPWGEIWESVYKILEETTVSNQLAAWIQPLKLAQFRPQPSAENGTEMLAVLRAPNDFSANWVNTHLLFALKQAFSQAVGVAVDVQVEAEALAGTADVLETARVLAVGSKDVLNETRAIPPLDREFSQTTQKETGLDPYYIFDTFVVGSSNQFAHASAAAVSENPGRLYNPLFLYSPPGLGKTHMLHAVGNQILQKNPQAKVLFISAEKFVNEVVESIRNQKMSQFRHKYRESYDVLLVDDIQFIAGKASSEEEFFHTFNALYGTKRQIVVTSDRPPQEMEVLEERMRTRFQCGLIADIGAPEIETRIAILKTKATRDDIYLPDEVATFVATHVKSNVRELEGILIKLQAVSSLTGAEISLEMAKQELKQVLPEEGAQFTAEAIQGAVAKHFHLKTQDLKTTSRARKYAFPRQIGMYLVRKYTGMGYQEIGHLFGGKDHTTVLHGFQKIESEVETSPEVRSAVESIQNLL